MSKIAIGSKKKRTTKILMLCVSILLLVVGVNILWSQLKSFYTTDVNVIYSAKATKSVQTKTKLKTNDIFTDDYDTDGYYTNQDNFYIAKLVDQVVVNFSDTLRLTDFTDCKIEVRQSVKEYLIVECDEGQILQELKSEITPPAKNYTNQAAIVLNQTVELSYEDYYNRFVEIKSALTGVNCRAYIQVDYILQCFGTINQKVFNYSDTLSSVAPVQNSGTFQFDNIYTPSTTLDQTNAVMHHFNIMLISTGSVCIGIGLLGICVVCLIAMKKTNQNKSQIFLRKIVSSYGDVIIESNSPMPIDEKWKMIEVEDFDDLLKVEAETSKPIILNTVKKGLHNFYLFADDIIYFWLFDETKVK